MPVVGCRDDRNLWFFLFQQVAVIHVPFRLVTAALADLFGGDFERRCICVTQRHNPATTRRHRLGENVLSPPTRTDQSRAMLARGRLGKSEGGLEGQTSCGDTLQKSTSVHGANTKPCGPAKLNLDKQGRTLVPGRRSVTPRAAHRPRLWFAFVGIQVQLRLFLMLNVSS